MTIHTEHPFDEPEDDPARRLRGRLGGTVSLWTAGGADPADPADPADRAGLTVTSYVVANGDPPHVLGLVDPESELAEAAQRTGRVVVQLLEWQHRDLSAVFAGLLPSPGGPFRAGTWRTSDWGPVLSDASAWAGVRLLGEPRDVGWSVLLEGVLEHVEVGESTSPLLHHRGRYRTLG